MVPHKSETATTFFYTYDFQEKVWTKGEFADYITSAGVFEGGSTTTIDQASGTINAAVGSINDQVGASQDKTILLGDKDGFIYQLVGSEKNFDGGAIDAEWQTKDWALAPDYMARNLRFGKVSYVAYGDLVSVSYSTDEGATWTALVVDQNLTSTRTEYSVSLNFSAPRTRFKVHDATAGKNFHLSQVGIEYMATTTRE